MPVIQKRIFDAKIYNVLTLNSTVRNITDIIRDIIPTLKIELTQSKIMNQLSYEVSNQKIFKAGFKVTGNIKENILETINLLQLRKQ